MFPDIPTAQSANKNKYDLLLGEFVGETRSQLATLTGEIALRNKVVQSDRKSVV